MRWATAAWPRSLGARFSPEERQTIVDTLRRHPRFDADFAGKKPDDVLAAGQSVQDRWIFQAAAYWPDIARGGPYDRPTWHYINVPIFVDPTDEQALRDELPFNQSSEYPPAGVLERMNVVQAIHYARATIANDAASPADKALAYCWLFHLVGDIHQPLHAVALVSVKQFPAGDRGGNSIPLRRGRNLHALWDGLLGTGERLRDVDREVTELSSRDRYGDVWDATSLETDPRRWAEESHAIARSAVYTETILDAVRDTQVGVQLEPLDLTDTYMREAGTVARRRLVMAGVRLRHLLHEQP